MRTDADKNSELEQAIGIFGGTFDPVHVGHLRCALEACEQLKLAEMRMVPSYQPPHREARASTEHRVAMLKLALRGQDLLKFDDREIKRAGKSFMVDTLAGLRDELPHTPLVLVLGADAFAFLPSWHEWQKLFDFAHIAVMTRPGHPPDYPADLQWQWRRRGTHNPDDLQSSLSGKLLELRVTALPISSTGIRGLIWSKRDPRFLIPAAVEDYIYSHGLYQE